MTRDELSAIRKAAAASRKIFAGGRPRSRKLRCPCGEMTAKRAAARKHKCNGVWTAEVQR